MKQHDVYAIQEHACRRPVLAVEPTCQRYGRNMQIIRELGYATDQLARFMKYQGVYTGSVPRRYRAVV